MSKYTKHFEFLREHEGEREDAWHKPVGVLWRAGRPPSKPASDEDAAVAQPVSTFCRNHGREHFQAYRSRGRLSNQYLVGRDHSRLIFYHAATTVSWRHPRVHTFFEIFWIVNFVDVFYDSFLVVFAIRAWPQVETHIQRLAEPSGTA